MNAHLGKERDHLSTPEAFKCPLHITNPVSLATVILTFLLTLYELFCKMGLHCVCFLKK